MVHAGATGAPEEGISHRLLQGAVDYAREQGAPAIEGYPVDNRGKNVDLTMAYVGTRKLFEERASRRRPTPTPCSADSRAW